MNSNLPVIILAGGYGTRFAEETDDKPKPMIRIGDKPILHHLIDIYVKQGFTNFIIATGYKHEVIDNWVLNNNSNKLWGYNCKIETNFTGEDALTGTRIRKIIESVNTDKFLVTYGDGLGNINLNKLINFHNQHGKIATVTSVRPPARFGVIESFDGCVTHFGEKSQADAGWINGGFFVLNQEVCQYISEKNVALEDLPMKALVEKGQLMTMQHFGFWQPMDTLREKRILTDLAATEPPIWLTNLSRE